MRIGLEASYAFMGRGGIDRYALELFGALLARQDGHEYVVFTMFAPFRRRNLSAAPFRGSVSRKLAMAQVELLRRIWSSAGGPPVEVFTGGVDVFHAVHHFAVPARRARLIATIHDLSFEYPEFAIENAALYSRDARRAVERADVVIAVSEFTKRELMRQYGIPVERIRVVPEGVNAARWQSVARGAPAGSPYFLAVGKVEPRKNLVELAQGFSIARQRSRLPHRLRIVGKLGQNGARLLDAIRRVPAGDAIDYLAFLQDDALARQYRGAAAFVYPSRYEGFGLPVLEAMAAGTPVIASAASAIPEVVGDAGVLVTPGDPERWASALERVVQDETGRTSLIRRGLEQARRFTWDRSAERVAAVYEELSRA